MTRIDRRSALAALAGLGIGTTTFQRALVAQLETGVDLTAEMIAQAEWVAGLELSEQERQRAARSVAKMLEHYATNRSAEVDYSTAPCLRFNLPPGDVRIVAKSCETKRS